MDEKIQSAATFTYLMMSNEDDFGVFLQGLNVGLTIAFGQEMKMDRAKIIETLASRGPMGFYDNAIRLHDMFMTSKRHAETMRIEFPDMINRLRSQVVSMIDRMYRDANKA